MGQAVEKKIESMGLALPPAAAPVASYVPYTLSGKLLSVSGQLPMRDGQPVGGKGKLGASVSIEDGQAAARQCVLNLLAHVKNACGGDLSQVKQILKLGVFVNCTEDFVDHPKVANGASDLMVELFGEAGKHARAAVGVAQLPFGVAVEVDALIELA